MFVADCSAKFYGDSCGKHGTYTFYPGLEYDVGGKIHRLMLGNFFPISLKSATERASVLNLIGELQLVWQDKNHEGEKLSSVKLYAKPEDCPGGRQPHHGQDEILAEESKVVLRLSELVGLLLSSSGARPDGERRTCLDDDGRCMCGGNDRRTSTCVKEKFSDPVRSIILSYPQYCRFRAAKKRLEHVDEQHHTELLLYLLGKNLAQNLPTGAKEGHVFFCRDTTTLHELKHIKDQLSYLAPRLKGRKRKKKNSIKSLDSDDSNESEVFADQIVLRKNHRPHIPPDFVVPQTGKRKKIITGQGSDLTTDKESFLKQLHQFMADNHSPIFRSPTLGFKEVDLYQFFVSTKKRGGYEEVTKRKLWKEIYDELGGSSCNTSAATGTRKNYEKFLQPFEKFLNGTNHTVSKRRYNKSKSSKFSEKVSNNCSTTTIIKTPPKPISKLNFSKEPFIVIKPVTNVQNSKDEKDSDDLEITKFETTPKTDASVSLLPSVPRNHSSTTTPASANQTVDTTSTISSLLATTKVQTSQLALSCTPSKVTISSSTFSSPSTNLFTISQKLMAGGQTVLKESDIRTTTSNQTLASSKTISESLDDTLQWNSFFTAASYPVFPLPLLSSVLSNASSSLSVSHAISKPISCAEHFPVKLDRDEKYFGAPFAEDLCIKMNKPESPVGDFKFTKQTELITEITDKPLDFSMKTLKKLEQILIETKSEAGQPLDLSMKKTCSENELETKNAQFQFADVQTPLDLSKSSVSSKDDKQCTSLPINLAQLLPLAFAMPLSSHLQVLPHPVLSPIQQNINMIYNPGSVNFPILSFTPTSTCASVNP